MNTSRRNPLLLVTAFFGYLFYFLGHLGFALFIVPLVLLLSPLPFTWRKTFLTALFQGYVTFLSRIYLPFLGIYRIRECSGFSNIKKLGPAVFVANHRSRIDGPLLLSLAGPAGTVMKGSYARNVLYSAFVRHFDFIAVDADSLSSIAAALDKARMVVGQKRNIVVFPEGTRARSGRVAPFKEIAFRIATELNLPVVPVVIHSTLPFMAKRPGSVFPGITFDMTVRALPPLIPASYKRPIDLASEAEKIIVRELKVLDKGTVWERSS